MFDLVWTNESQTTYDSLKNNSSDKARFNAVKKTIINLARNPRHPGLQTHPYDSLTGPNGEKVFEAYAQQKTPAAYRVFWYYGPAKGMITILAITEHP